MASINDNCDLLDGKKVQINYPTNWEYKVIGLNKNTFEPKIKTILQNRDPKITFSNSSNSKKYISLNVVLWVHSNDDRLAIFELLKNDTDVKYVL